MGTKGDKAKDTELASNRRAFHNYEILESFEAGISLLGTEVKSLRDSGGNIQDGYIRVTDSEIFLLNASITPYQFGNIHNHEERRERKLLMHKKEIRKLKIQSSEKGLTIIPLSLYLKGGKVKVKIALVKGKRTFDKRESIKKRESDRALQREVRHHIVD
jgi:SsrA-binding protein